MPPARRPRRRRRNSTAWGAAGLLPVALGIAAGATGGAGATNVNGTGSTDPSGVEVSALTGVAATIASIPRLGLSAPAQEISGAWAKPAPNKSQLGACGWFGSAGADRITNQRKNRTDLPQSYHAVTLDAITDLDWPRDAKTRRDKWTAAQLAEIAPYEGVAVVVTGFVVAFRPQSGNSESTNCGEGGEENTDWHVALVGEFGDPESQAVVVEPTPRLKRRIPAWTPAAMRPLVGSQDSVRFSGYLLMDPVHKNHLGKYRRTLWEVHPVHRIEVFRNGRWGDLEAP